MDDVNTKPIILTEQERQEVFAAFKEVSFEKWDNTALFVVKRLMERLDGCDYWVEKDAMFTEFGLTDGLGYKYSIERSVFPTITYALNTYNLDGNRKPLSDRYEETAANERIFGPMNCVFKQIERRVAKQERQKPKQNIFGRLASKVKSSPIYGIVQAKLQRRR